MDNNISQLNLQAHLKTAPANAATKVFKRASKANPREEFQNFSPTLKRKKLKHANTQETQTEKKK